MSGKKPEYGVEISAWSRLWQSIKPPPSARKGPRFSPVQKKMMRIVLIVLGVIAAGGGGYWYYVSAPDRAEAKFQDGLKLMSPGSYPQAIAIFDSVISTWDRHSQAFLHRGNAKQILGQLDGALADFEQAAALDPTLAEAFTARGTILRDRGDSRRAIDEFTKSLNIRPTMDGYYQRGQLWAKLGDHQKAIEDYDRAVYQNRSAPYVYRARGDEKRQLGDIAGYEEDRDKAKSLEHRR